MLATYEANHKLGKKKDGLGKRANWERLEIGTSSCARTILTARKVKKFRRFVAALASGDASPKPARQKYCKYYSRIDEERKRENEMKPNPYQERTFFDSMA